MAAERSGDIKLLVFFYVFYSLAPLLCYDFDFFLVTIKYCPDAVVLAMYILVDLFMLAAVWTSFYLNRPLCWDAERLRISWCILVCIGVFAEIIHVSQNYQFLFLQKSEYISQVGLLVPNLLFFSIPAESIIVSGALFSPFKSVFLRRLVAVLAIVVVGLSVVQGYRHLALFTILILFFRRFPSVSVAWVVLLASFVGEISNPIKYFIAGFLISEDFSVSGFVDHYIDTFDFQISGEQLAVVSNFLIGKEVVGYTDGFPAFGNLLPFSSGIFESRGGLADVIGGIVGVGDGQGTAYSFQLFVISTMGVGLFFIFLPAFFMRRLFGTPLFVFSCEIFQSMLRNTPEHWLAQLKMLALLWLLIFTMSYLVGFVTAPGRRLGHGM